jgi:hypothetical protein
MTQTSIDTLAQRHSVLQTIAETPLCFRNQHASVPVHGLAMMRGW